MDKKKRAADQAKKAALAFGHHAAGAAGKAAAGGSGGGGGSSGRPKPADSYKPPAPEPAAKPTNDEVIVIDPDGSSPDRKRAAYHRQPTAATEAAGSSSNNAIEIDITPEEPSPKAKSSQNSTEETLAAAARKLVSSVGNASKPTNETLAAASSTSELESSSSSVNNAGSKPRKRKREGGSNGSGRGGGKDSTSPSKKKSKSSPRKKASVDAIAAQAAINLGLSVPPKPKLAALSPFICYCKDHRETFAAEYPSQDVAKAIGAAWKDLPEDEKEPYKEKVRMARKDDDAATRKYEKEMDVFRAANPRWEVEKNTLLQQQEEEESKKKAEMKPAAAAAAAAASADSEKKPRSYLGNSTISFSSSSSSSSSPNDDAKLAREIDMLSSGASSPRQEAKASATTTTTQQQQRKGKKKKIKSSRKRLSLNPTDALSPSSSEDTSSSPSRSAAATIVVESPGEGVEEPPSSLLDSCSRCGSKNLGLSEGSIFDPAAGNLICMSCSESTTRKNSSEGDELIQSLIDGRARLNPRYVILLNNVEVVLASKDDVARKSARSHYREGNVGFRCIHCKHLPRSAQAKQALGFPSSIDKLSGSFSNLTTHFSVCSFISSDLRSKLLSGGREAPSDPYVPFTSYCTAAAKRMGMEQDPQGTIRFSFTVPRGQEPTLFLMNGIDSDINPPPAAAERAPSHRRLQDNEVVAALEQQNVTSLAPTEALRRATEPLSSSTADEILQRIIRSSESEPNPLISANERSQTTDLMYLILNQFDICSLTKEDKSDKSGKRKHLPLGHPGLRCRRCRKTFFYSGTAGFSTRIYDRLFPHLQKCCSENVKQALARAENLRELQTQERSLRGDRSPTTFASRVFQRLLGRQGINAATNSATTDGRISVMPSASASASTSASASSRAHQDDASATLDATSATIFEQEMAKANARTNDIFDSSDRHTATDFNYLVLRQFGLCHRTADEKLSRYPTGYPGLCCVKCDTKMYFPDAESFMKQFSQKLHGHLLSCPGSSRELRIAIAYALKNRDIQKRQLGDSGSLTSFCERVLGKMLQNANMTPLPKKPFGPTSSSSSKLAVSSSKNKGKSPPAIDSNDMASSDEDDATLSPTDREAIKRVLTEAHGLQCPFIDKDEMHLSSDYNYVVLKQFEVCKLAKEDPRYQAGHPGFECRKCSKAFYFRDADLFGKLFNQNLGEHLKTCAPSSDLQLALARLKAQHGRQVRRVQMSSKEFFRLVYSRLCKATGADVPAESLSTPSPPFRSSSFRGRREYSRARSSTYSSDSSDDEDESIPANIPIPPVVAAMDRSLATDYHFELLSQYGTVQLSKKEKRRGKFVGIAIGQPGLICRACKETKFFFQSADSFKDKCFYKCKDHLKSCESCPADIRQRITSVKQSQIQKQLRALEGGTTQRLLQRLWMRLNRDWSRSREIKANSRAIPLFQDESDVDLFESSDANSSNDAGSAANKRRRSTASFSSSSSSDEEDNTSDSDDFPSHYQGPAPAASPASISLLNSTRENDEEAYVPGYVTSDLTHYTTLTESIVAVADKLGCHWKDVAEQNKGRYRSLRTNAYQAKFKEGTVLVVPQGDGIDISILMELTKPMALPPPGAKDDSVETVSTGGRNDSSNAEREKESNQVEGGTGTITCAQEENTDGIRLDKFIACIMGLTRDCRALNVQMLADERFVAIIRALVANGETGRNEPLVDMLTVGLRDAAFGPTTIVYWPLNASVIENAVTNKDALVKALSLFAESRGGLFELVENENFIAFTKIAAPHCKLPSKKEVMLWGLVPM